MSVNDLKVQLEVKGHEKLKECADNVIGAFILVTEAVEELSGCMLELKVSDPYENKKMESEEVDVCKVGVIESGTGMTTTVVSEKSYSKMTQDCEGINLKIQDASSEEKEVFNAEEIIEDMILKLKEKFNECSLEKGIPGAFDRVMIVSEEIRKLTECWIIVKNTPKTGVCDVSGYWAQAQANPISQEIEPVECYEIKSLDQVVQVALDLTLDLLKKDSKTYEDVFENFKKLKGKLKFINEDMDDVQRLLLSQVEKMLTEEMKQTKILL